MAAQYDNTMSFSARERLQGLHSAYVGLEVLAGLADVDSHHVAAVLAVVNEALGQLVEGAGPSRPGGGLRLVGE